jgi:very-short-patch-repair endonuclease
MRKNVISFCAFLDRARVLFGDTYEYDESTYTNMKKLMKINCSQHGWFIKSPCRHLKGEGCKKCSFIKSSRLRTLPFVDFVRRSKETHGDRYVYDESCYRSTNRKAGITCSIHGVFWQLPRRHMQGHGCRTCAFESTASIKSISFDEFVRRSRENHIVQYEYIKDSYLNLQNRVRIVCPVHGEFSQKAADHIRGSNCSLCRISSGEEAIARCLRMLGVSFEPQKSFEDLAFKYRIRFDFYCKDHNVLIEFDGLQHYAMIPTWHKTVDAFLRQRMYDAIKTLYCEENGIRLLRVCYLDKDRIPEIVSEFLAVAKQAVA